RDALLVEIDQLVAEAENFSRRADQSGAQQHRRGLAKRGMKLRVIIEGGRAEIALTDGRPRQPDVVDDMRCRVREIGDDMAHLDMTEGVALPYIDGAARTVEQVIE